MSKRCSTCQTSSLGMFVMSYPVPVVLEGRESKRRNTRSRRAWRKRFESTWARTKALVEKAKKKAVREELERNISIEIWVEIWRQRVKEVLFRAELARSESCRLEIQCSAPYNKLKL